MKQDEPPPENAATFHIVSCSAVVKRRDRWKKYSSVWLWAGKLTDAFEAWGTSYDGSEILNEAVMHDPRENNRKYQYVRRKQIENWVFHVHYSLRRWQSQK